MDNIQILGILIMMVFIFLCIGIIAIVSKIDKVQNTINELGKFNSTLISAKEEASKTMLDICRHIKEVIILNAKLINDSLNTLKDKH